MIFSQDFIHKIICGDCLQVMSQIPDGAIDRNAQEFDKNCQYLRCTLNNKFLFNIFSMTPQDGLYVIVI